MNAEQKKRCSGVVGPAFYVPRAPDPCVVAQPAEKLLFVTGRLPVLDAVLGHDFEQAGMGKPRVGPERLREALFPSAACEHVFETVKRHQVAKYGMFGCAGAV